MEVKKIVEGMTAPQVAQVIDDNFKAQNAILEEDIAKQNNVIGVSEYKDFSEAEAVNVGDVRKYNGLLYECVEATTGAFDASKWKKSSFKAETEKKISDIEEKTDAKLSELGSEVFYFESNWHIGDINQTTGNPNSSIDKLRIYSEPFILTDNYKLRVNIKGNSLFDWITTCRVYVYDKELTYIGVVDQSQCNYISDVKDNFPNAYAYRLQYNSFTLNGIVIDASIDYISYLSVEGRVNNFYITNTSYISQEVENIKDEVGEVKIGLLNTNSKIEEAYHYPIYELGLWHIGDINISTGLPNTDIDKQRIYSDYLRLPSDLTLRPDIVDSSIFSWIRTIKCFAYDKDLTYLGVATQQNAKSVKNVIDIYPFAEVFRLEFNSFTINDNPEIILAEVEFVRNLKFNTTSQIEPYFSARINRLDKEVEALKMNVLIGDNVASLNGGIAELTSKFRDLCKIRKESASVSGNKIVNLLYFSDLHNYTSDLERIISFKNTFSEYINDMLHGGDFVNDRWGDENPFENVEGGDMVLNVLGNHDVSDFSGLEDDSVNNIVTDIKAYNKYFAPFVEKWGVVTPPNASTEGHCFWYKDYSAAKLRLIGLNCMNWSFNQVQQEWLEEVLSDATAKDYAVIICEHYCPNTSFKGLKECTFQTLYRSSPSSYLGSDGARIVQDAIDGGLKFVCWLFGHEHLDFFGVLENYPKQYALAVDKAHADESWERDCCRSGNDRERDAFDVVSIDTSSGMLTVMRIGNNRDKYMRQKNFLTFDYVNSKIVGNS